MLIKELADKCNITKKAVQYYVEQGLIVPEVQENGYKVFSEQDEELLKQIVLYRKLDLSIEDIKRVLNNKNEITSILHQRTLQLEREKIKQQLLRKIEAGECVEKLASEINNITSNDIIIKKLTEIFPSYFGKFISMWFAEYLTGEIETEEQQEAFCKIIDFFDDVPDIHVPEDLQQFMDEMLEAYSGAEGTEKIHTILQEKNVAFRNIDEFVEKNRDVLDKYQQFKQTDEYKNSPVFRLSEYMKEICASNGYYDVFIPAMRKLSPAYNEYYEQLLKANEMFMKIYPEYL